MLLLLAGIVTSAATAWGVEIWGSYTWRPPPPGDYWLIEFNGSGVVHACDVVTRNGSAQWFIKPNPGNDVSELTPASIVPSWVERPDPNPNRTISTAAYGFPFLCMKWYTVTTLDPVMGGSVHSKTHFMWPLRINGRFGGWIPLAPPCSRPPREHPVLRRALQHALDLPCPARPPPPSPPPPCALPVLQLRPPRRLFAGVFGVRAYRSRAGY
jgi:hypothetical protein